MQMELLLVTKSDSSMLVHELITHRNYCNRDSQTLKVLIAIIVYVVRPSTCHCVSMLWSHQRFGRLPLNSVLLYVLLVRLHHFNDCSYVHYIRYLILNFGNLDNAQFNMW